MTPTPMSTLLGFESACGSHSPIINPLAISVTPDISQMKFLQCVLGVPPLLRVVGIYQAMNTASVTVLTPASDPHVLIAL